MTLDAHFPDRMPDAFEANDNSAAQDWRHCKRLQNDWGQYKEIRMTAFGPIGILPEGFVYLDPETAAARG